MPNANANAAFGLGQRLLSRRSVLRGMGAALFPLCADWARAAASAGSRVSKAKSVIMIFNGGAPSHLDLWDPKPDAADDIRGPFKPIRTNVTGIHISELLPRMAKRMDKVALIRSVHHGHSSHNGGMHWATVGRPYAVDSTLVTPSRTDIPCFGTLIGWLAQRDGLCNGVPPYVITPFPHCDSKVYLTPGQFGGCLGARFDPYVLDDDPNAASFKVRNLALDESLSPVRFQERLGLLQELTVTAPKIASPNIAEIDVFNQQAANLLRSGKAADAFDLSKEPTAVRERYGRHSWGQSHLLARRLIESGTRFVSTVNGPSITWDTHKDNFNALKNRLVPPMEQAYAALLDDLEERGLLDTTLVIWMGEFGRTPKINADVGRDHWPGCYSVLMAGGGIRGGQVVGASDAIGAHPKERPITPADIHATVYAALGYDAGNLHFTASDGRPVPVCEGTPISELI
ncbi:MAG: DUF1501 domain-containing protein [Verrucomicrobia bacterium]|nr:DUF1501 domain-containing protein [Verrucomicrobiota bacterium]NBU09675.1 DUF1501 domain-containing protein [Pseudomonadota bacterium]NDA67365.1 DUF1501 domain-containing protein [Verrucomicrobiota bacterium]NDB76181.1 DUF1501 domain-containing protein [Verrucomicrobiota bacterium]NDD39242.1 DUF1501 domain-containing protein [Verrucomicrobiota bacterium]